MITRESETEARDDMLRGLARIAWKRPGDPPVPTWRQLTDLAASGNVETPRGLNYHVYLAPPGPALELGLSVAHAPDGDGGLALVPAVTMPPGETPPREEWCMDIAVVRDPVLLDGGVRKYQTVLGGWRHATAEYLNGTLDVHPYLTLVASFQAQSV